MKDSDWLGCVRVYNGYWQRGKLERDAIEVWKRKFGDLEQALVLAALDLLAEQPGREFAPTINEVLGVVAAVRGDQVQRDWSDAYGELVGLVRSIGQYQGYRLRLPGQPDPTGAELNVYGVPDVEISDPGVVRWIAMCGGWSGVCQLNYADAATRAQFRDVHRQAADGETERRRLAATSWRAIPGSTPIEVEATT